MSKELLETKESGVLCIITKKSGSSPRGVGSMMLVTKDGIIGSIGGGNLEKTVMEEDTINQRDNKKRIRSIQCPECNTWHDLWR